MRREVAPRLKIQNLVGNDWHLRPEATKTLRDGWHLRPGALRLTGPKKGRGLHPGEILREDFSPTIGHQPVLETAAARPGFSRR